VLAARAVSDGDALDAVLYPGRGPGRHPLVLARLVPGRRYRCEGCADAEGVADAQGRLRTSVALEGRTTIRIVPLA
jgi:hypothetical protein